MAQGKRVIVAVTGASGALYATRLLRALLRGGHSVDLILSKYGRYLLVEEMGLRPDEETITEFLQRLYGDEISAGRLVELGLNDLTCAVASGSVSTDGMVVIPCSTKTLAGIANGSSTNLIERSADVSLKERRPLVIVPRETPLNLIQLRNLTTVAEAGASVVPAMPAFYQKPASFDDLGDFIAGRVLNLLHIEHDLFTPWRAGG
jgi:4-hydroxy-3-polyprenylbenzoate decarboxylase